MKTKQIITLIGTFFFIVTANAVEYKIDAGHSNVEFKIRHLGISTVTGNYKIFEGSFNYDKKKGKLSKVVLSIESASITTNNKKRDDHLKSPDFFNVEKFPKITFTSTSITSPKNGSFKITGDFEMHGVKKVITLDATFNGAATSPWGQKVISFTGSSKLNRKDYGLTWNKALESGGFLVGEEVKIVLDIEASEPQPDSKKPTKK